MRVRLATYLSHLEPGVPERPEHFAFAVAHWAQAVPHLVVGMAFVRIILNASSCWFVCGRIRNIGRQAQQISIYNTH